MGKERDTRARTLGILGLGAGIASIAFTLCDRQTVHAPTIDPDRVSRLEEIARGQSEAVNLNYYGDYINEMILRGIIGGGPVSFEDFLAERYEWRQKVRDEGLGK